MRALSSYGSASLLLITVPPPWESWKPICIPSGGKRSGFYIPTFQHSFSTFYKGSRDWLWSCWAGNAAGAVQAKTWSGRFCVLRQAAGGWWHVDRRPKVFTNVTVINLMDFGFPFYFPSSTHAGALMGTWRLFTGTMGCGLTVPLTIRNTRRKCILLIFMASLFDG